MKKIKSLLLILLLFYPLGGITANAEEVTSETTEEIVGDNEVKDETNSNYVVPSSEDLDSINEMKVVDNVDDKGNTFDSEKLAGTKQFLTVVTPDGRTYYIVISYEQFGTKVNLLKDMSESDIQSVSDNQPQAGAMTQEQAEKLMRENAASGKAAENGTQTENSGPNLYIILIGMAIVGAFGYFKVKKGKGKNQNSFQ